MARSGHVAELRRLVGSRPLLLPSAAVCLYDAEGRLLVARHADGGRWGTPGGAIEFGETPAEAAVREAREELGLEVRPEAIVGVFGGPGFETTYENGDEVAYVTTAFACRVVGGSLSFDDGELLETAYVDVAAARALPLAAWLQHALPSLLAWAEEGGGSARFDPPR